MKKEITYKELQKMFTQFLKKRKAYKEFKRNCLIEDKSWKRVIYPLHEYQIRNFIKRGTIPPIINYSFIWTNTKEGSKYWSDLNKEWSYLTAWMKLKSL